MKKVGLALGGGGAKAMFHLGLVETLKKNNIPIGQIVGTSMGAIIGAAAACEIDTQVVLDYLDKHLPKKPIALRKINLEYTSLISPKEFEKFLEHLFKDRLIEDCAIPFSCLAVDIESGKLVELKEGSVCKAVRASSSLPFILPPVYHMEKLLIDGGMLNNVPADYLKDELCDVTMAVKLSSFKNQSKLAAITFNQYIAPKKKDVIPIRRRFKRVKNSLEIMAETLLRSLEISSDANTSVHLKESKPDMLIDVDLSYGIMEFGKGFEAIEKGREVMKGKMDELKKLIES